jgi:DNA polymerase III delta subunit
MLRSLEAVLRSISNGKPPRVILVGGTSDFLAERASTSIRNAVVAANPAISVEAFEPASELSSILDSYRTMSLFGGGRLLIVPEVNAFVSRKELSALYDKAVADWKGARTDRKRMSSAAKMLHLLGLVGADLDMNDSAIAAAVGFSLEGVLSDILAFCRASGKKPTRGEDDASMLSEAIARGGASGTLLLLRTGEIPAASATVELIDREGAVVVCNLDRDEVVGALDDEIAQLAIESGATFDQKAVARLRQRLGIERTLADKFSRDVPDIRFAVSETERLLTLVGPGGRVTPELVDQEIASVEGGARYELGSLFLEGKMIEAVAKLRDLVAQARREDPRSAVDVHYGRFLFPLADELRQMIGILSFSRIAGIDLRQPMQYNRFKDTVAERLGDYLKANGIVRQRPHPFPLHKRMEAVRKATEEQLFEGLAALAEIDIQRKSGGVPADVALESFLLSRLRA